ncbi:MAG: thiol oxidoreductase [Bdellovibrionales bacterium]|nr:thiol oxidoreductase [Bdellovibrionales bacterium]
MFALIFLVASAWAATPDYSGVLRLGGDTTVVLKVPTVQAFRNPAQNLSDELVQRHFRGDRLFEAKFSDDPDRPDYGLGPVFNHISCLACHILDGRGALPVMGDGSQWVKLGSSASVFLRISSEAEPSRFDASDNWGAPRPVTGFGNQLFHLGSFGVRDDLPGTGQAEVYAMLEWSTFRYPDGREVRLRRPVFKFQNPYDSATTNHLNGKDVRFGPRMTPPMIGLGLLEAIPQQDILDLALRDLSAWGISGHPNWVLDRAKQLSGDPYPVSLGRFGLKANTPSVLHQTAGALQNDMGVTNPLFPSESISGTPLFDAFKERWRPSLEASQETLDLLVFYSQTLAVPSRRDIEKPLVRAGGRLFHKVGCANCHHPSFVTGAHALAPLSRQTIYPFTDMLLHDMGEGLADGRSDFHASGREWKTRALWGVGLTQIVNPRAGFLHDGRASTLEEAILWHGGEAETSRQRFAELSGAERDSLLEFLKSL